ncbi:spore germination protein GerW family protein [Actinoplanes sp. NPDC049681]|uniref:spore germination protein GerW family protein n=1 Tax=Actinoplanes sp. NPDC049681 TaxID=3363905 RepID=UPI0037B83E6D
MTVAPTQDARLLDMLREVVDNATVGKVFGAPITQGQTIVLPVAKVGGGAGGGSGTGPAPDGQPNGGTGGGLGMSAKPLGVFVLSAGKVSWHPAIDVNRVVLGGQVVAVTALILARTLVKARADTARHRGAMRRLYESSSRLRRIGRPSRSSRMRAKLVR